MVVARVLFVVAAITLAGRWISADTGTRVPVLDDVIGRQILSLRLVARGDASAIKETFRAPSRQLLVVFSAGCSVSRSARPKWEDLTERLRRDVPVYGLSVDDPAAVDHGVRFFVNDRIVERHADPLELRRLLPVDHLPITLVLSPDGTVEFAEIGVPTQRGVRVLARMLNARL
jgi:hypothetical protein